MVRTVPFILFFFTFFVAAVTGCYGSAPPPAPAIAVRPISGQPVLVQEHERTVVERLEQRTQICPTYGSAEGCYTATTMVPTPVTHYWATASYGGRGVTRADVAYLADPAGWQAKVESLNADRSSCKLANVPRWLGTGLLVGGLIAAEGIPHKSADGSTPWATRIGAGAMLAGAASYVTGYFFFGGMNCNRAQATYNALPKGEEAEGQTAMKELQEDAARYNAGASAGATTGVAPQGADPFAN
jgi:hypothetical protein